MDPLGTDRRYIGIRVAHFGGHCFTEMKIRLIDSNIAPMTFVILCMESNIAQVTYLFLGVMIDSSYMG